MNNNMKPNEQYVDGRDKWIVHYITTDETRVNPGDYKQVIELFKNGELVGQTIWHKDKDGNDKTPPYQYGKQQIPSTARRLNS